MTPRLRPFAAVIAASVLATAAFAAAPPGTPGRGPGAGADPLRPVTGGQVEGQVIVRFVPGAGRMDRQDVFRRLRVTGVRPLPLRRAFLLHLPAGTSVSQALQDLAADPRVQSAQPNYRKRLAGIPNDPLFGNQWGLRNTGATVGGIPGTADADADVTEAWDVTTGSPDVTVAVVDSGITAEHPDLAARIVPGYDFVDDDANPADPSFYSHGTFVAGVVGSGADDTLGIAGVARTAKIMPLRIFDEEDVTTSARIVAAYEHAVANGARVVNASFNGPAFDPAEHAVIAANPEVLFVAAAGNSGVALDGPGGVPQYPCAYDLPNVLCVAASDQNDDLAVFSNTGATSVDVAAPGENIVTTARKPGPVLFQDNIVNNGLGGNWATGGVNNTWGVDTTAGFGDSRSMADSPAGNYQNNTASFSRIAQTLPLDFGGKSGCGVSYDLRLATGPGPDALRVEGASSLAGPWTVQDSLTGSTGGQFVPITSELNGLNGVATARLRFSMVSDASVVAAGANIDNIVVRCAATGASYTGAVDEYLFVDGTSFAAPLVSGVAALLLSLDPAMTGAELRERIVATVDPKAALSGEVVSGGRVNADAAVRMPPIAETGEVTGVTSVAATVGGTVRTRAQATTVRVEYGLTSAYGTSVPGAPLAAGLRAPQAVSVPLTGLASGVTYHYRLVATGPFGVWEGADRTFSTPSVGSAPVATDDALTVAEDTVGVVEDVLANDTDPDVGDTLTVSEWSGGAHGSATCSPAGRCEYTPDADFSGTDRFTYVVADGTGGFDTGAVDVTVTPVNDPPVAGPDSLTVVSGGVGTRVVLANDADVDGPALTVTGQTSGAHGTASCTALGVCTFTANAGYVGPDAFTYTLSDGTLTTQGVVNVTVVAAPVAPSPPPVTVVGQPPAPSTPPPAPAAAVKPPSSPPPPAPAPCSKLTGKKRTVCLLRRKVVVSCAKRRGAAKALCLRRGYQKVRCDVMRPGKARAACYVRLRAIR